MGVDPGTAEPLLSYNTCSGGDSATGAALVVDLTGAGLRAARSIHMYMTVESLTPPLNTLFKKNIPESIFKSVSGIAPKKRTPMPELPVDEHTKSFVEADLVITKADALYEANRCLLKKSLKKSLMRFDRHRKMPVRFTGQLPAGIIAQTERCRTSH